MHLSNDSRLSLINNMLYSNLYYNSKILEIIFMFYNIIQKTFINFVALLKRN